MAVWESKGLLFSIREFDVIFDQVTGARTGSKEEIAMVEEKSIGVGLDDRHADVGQR